MQTLSFQASAAMSKKLNLYAKKLDRSKGYLIREALAEYLEDLQDYIEIMREKEMHERRHERRKNISLADIKRKYKLK